MRKLLVMLFALFAVAVVGSAMAASAFATELPAEWLVNGNPIPAGTTVPTETSVQLTFEDTKTLLGAQAFLCSMIFDGAMGPEGKGEVTEVLNLKGEKIGVLGGLALLGEGAGAPDCIKVSLCSEGSAASPMEVWPVGLPWKTLLYLEDSEIRDLFEGVGYELLCLVLGTNVEDTCVSADSSFPVLNDPETGDAEIPADSIAEPLGECTQSKEASSVTETDELTFVTTSAGLLTVSSEGDE